MQGRGQAGACLRARHRRRHAVVHIRHLRCKQADGFSGTTHSFGTIAVNWHVCTLVRLAAVVLLLQPSKYLYTIVHCGHRTNLHNWRQLMLVWPSIGFARFDGILRNSLERQQSRSLNELYMDCIASYDPFILWLLLSVSSACYLFRNGKLLSRIFCWEGKAVGYS